MLNTGTFDLPGQLQRRLPSGWLVRTEREPSVRRGQRAGRPDLLLTAEAPDGTKSTVIVEIKQHLEPHDVASAIAQLREISRGILLLYAPYLSPRTRERIVELGANYADATGNLRLSIERPALFIETQGADRDPNPKPRALGSLKGPAAARVVRAVCDLCPPYGVRELAKRSDTSLASISRVLSLLDREALIERDKRGQVQNANWENVIRRWIQDYDVATSNRTSTWLAARGFESIFRQLPDKSSRYVATGSFAAYKLAPVAAPRLLTLFVDDANEAASKLDLRPAEAGANVLLVEPFDSVVYDRTIERDGLVLANPSQIAADLLTSPGRSPAEAESLIQWMKDNEDAWRS